MSSSVAAPERRTQRALRVATGLLCAAGLIALAYSLDLLLVRGAHPHLMPPDPSTPIGYFPRMLRALALGGAAALIVTLATARLGAERQLRLGGWVLGLGVATAATLALLFP